jgi:hypothetical protein
MFDTLFDLMPRDSDYPERVRKIATLNSVLDGTLYDVLPFHFHEERTEAGDYIPLRQRRPSVRYPLCRTVVEDSVSLLFGAGHFPTIQASNLDVERVLGEVIKETRLRQTMIDAAMRGAVGSVALLLRVIANRLFVDVLDTQYLMPVWDPHAPDTLLRVDERYKVSGKDLQSLGYDIVEPDAQYWFGRTWDADSEIWYVPTPVASSAQPQIDTARTTTHLLGEVPIVWIKNLPGRSWTGDPNDGTCTFAAAMHTQVEIDYQLSQVGRGLKYSSDPTLVLKDPALPDGDIVKGSGNALIVSEKGDARLLEIGGTASAAVIEYVRVLRELALESIHGNRASPDRLTSAQSGRALEMLNQGLIWLADNLRTSYGEGGLLPLARLIVKASQVYDIKTHGQPIGPIDTNVSLRLAWPRWYHATADDRQKDAQSVVALLGAGCISPHAASQISASLLDLNIGEQQDIEATNWTTE